MSALIEKPSEIAPAVHLEFIQNQAGLPEADGMEEIEAYHRSLFLHHHARDLERFQQEARIHGDRLAHAESRLREIQTRSSALPKVLPVHMDGQPDLAPSSPWNAWDLAMFTAGALGILSLLLFGILNVSFNLLESGLVTFIQNPARAYFWAALLPVGALTIKVGWDCLQGPRKREIYLWACLGIGIAGVLAWLGAYASVYPTLSKSTRDSIQSLSVFDANAERSAFTGAGAKWVDVIIVSSQATAEIFLSAVLGIYLTNLYARHRPVRLAANPLFAELELERRELDQEVEKERLALADAKGNQTRLENELSALVAYARSLFQKEAALRRDQSQQKKILLDQISEQIRSQLAHAENGSLGPQRHAR